MSEDTDNLPAKRGPGRPPGSTKKKGPGRPKGEAGIMNEYKLRMLNSPKSRKVLDAIFEAALDPEHKNQAAAWKLIMDRIAPVSGFEKEVAADQGRGAIQINISGVPNVQVGSGETLEHEDTEGSGDSGE